MLNTFLWIILGFMAVGLIGYLTVGAIAVKIISKVFKSF